MSFSRPKPYSLDDVKNALSSLKSGVSLAFASKKFGVPKTTLRSKYKGIFPVDARPGPPTILTTEEEKLLVNWIFFMSERGFPITKCQLLDSVQQLLTKLKRDNPFTNGRPGRHWWEAFLKRHSELSLRMSQNLTHCRAALTEEVIRKWFAEIESYLSSKDLFLIDPKRVFNCDETAFFLSPKGGEVIVRRGAKAVYAHINNDEKECLTTLVTGNAAGDLPPPMVMFQYKRIPYNISESIPKDWGIGRSENGWMTGESFYEYISNVFYPWLIENSIQLPVVLYVDGHVSHLTMALSDFCVEHQIELIALFPNATHILQPMDVALFHPLKSAWKKTVLAWRMNNDGQRLRKEHFAPLLQKALSTLNVEKILRNGFAACGLHPLNADAINYNKLKKSDPEFAKSESLDVENEIQPHSHSKLHLDFIENSVAKETLQLFKNAEKSGIWNGEVKDEGVFYLWIKLRRLVKANQRDGDVVESEVSIQEDNNIVELIEISVPHEFDPPFISSNTTIVHTSNTLEEQFKPISEEGGENEKHQNLHEFFKDSDNAYALPATNNVVVLDLAELSVGNSLDPEDHFVNELSHISSSQTKNVVEQNDSSTMSSQVETMNLCDATATLNQAKTMDQEDSITASDSPTDQSPTKTFSFHKETQPSWSNVPDKHEEEPNKSLERIPEAFTDALFWPGPKKDTNTKRKMKEKMPSVATSQKWRQLNEEKMRKKKEEEEAKEQRKLIRLNKKKIKQEKIELAKKKVEEKKKNAEKKMKKAEDKKQSVKQRAKKKKHFMVDD